MTEPIVLILKCDVCLLEFRREAVPKESHGLGLFTAPELRLEVARESWVVERLEPIRYGSCCDDCWVTIRSVVVQVIEKLKSDPRPMNRTASGRCV